VSNTAVSTEVFVEYKLENYVFRHFNWPSSGFLRDNLGSFYI